MIMCILAEHMHTGCVHMISTDIPGAFGLGGPVQLRLPLAAVDGWCVSLATLDFYLITYYT